MNPLDLILWSLAGAGAIVAIGIAVSVAIVAVITSILVIGIRESAGRRCGTSTTKTCASRTCESVGSGSSA